MQISLHTMETCEHNVKLDDKIITNLLELQNVIHKLQDLKNFSPCAMLLFSLVYGLLQPKQLYLGWFI